MAGLRCAVPSAAAAAGRLDEMGGRLHGGRPSSSSPVSGGDGGATRWLTGGFLGADYQHLSYGQIAAEIEELASQHPHFIKVSTRP